MSRRGLEISMVKLAAQRRTADHLAAMEETVAALEASQNDLSVCVDKDIEFHEIMAQATGNRVFEMIHDSIAELLRESRRETLLSSGVDKPVSEHRQILKAIREKDQQGAVAAMTAHLDMAESSLKHG